MVTAVVVVVSAAAGVAATAVVVAEEMANAMQTVEAEAKTQKSTIKKQKQFAAKTTAEAEVVWRPSAEEGKAAMVAVMVMAMAEGVRVVGRRGVGGGGGGGGGAAEETAATVVAECSRCHPKLSMTITTPAKSGVIPAWTMTAAAEAAVVARRIATPPTPTGGRL